MTQRAIFAAFAFSTLCLSATASADEVATADPVVTTPFELESLGDQARLGAELFFGTGSVELFGTAEIKLVTLDLVGQVPIGQNLIVFGSFPLVYANWSYEADLPGDVQVSTDDSGTGIGNLTGGAMFVQRSQSVTIGGGASVSLPTASDEDEAGTAAADAALLRMNELGRYAPNTTTLRLHGDVRLESGVIFVQGRVGVDYLNGDEDEAENEDDDLTLLRIAVAAGAHVAKGTAVLAEVHTLSDVLDDDVDQEDYLHFLDLGVRHRLSPNLTLGARFYYPLDEAMRDYDIWGVAIDARGQL